MLYSHALASAEERHRDLVLEEGDRNLVLEEGDTGVEAHHVGAGRRNQQEGMAVGLLHIEGQGLEVAGSNWGWGGTGCRSAWGQAEKAGRACSSEARHTGHEMHKDHHEPHLQSGVVLYPRLDP